VNAIAYGIGVHEDQELIWKCNVCNIKEMNTIFGINWDDSGIFRNLSSGKRMKWKINKIEMNETFLKINFSNYGWTSEKTWGTNHTDSEIIYFSNPKAYSQELNFSVYSSLVPFWFPIPVGEYLGRLKMNQWYDVDNRVLPTINVDLDKDSLLPGFPSKDIQIIAIYNDQGILNSYKLYIRGNIVIIDIAFDYLPLHVIPTLIGLFCILILSAIIYIFKKKNSREIL
jgi:hypothetical protein